MEPTSLACPRCGSTYRQIKYGKSQTGKQCFQCRDCHYRYVQHPASRSLDPALRRQALRLYLEGNNFRRIARLLGINHQTVINWVRAEEAAQPPAPQPQTTEMDELYALHAKKGPPSS